MRKSSNSKTMKINQLQLGADHAVNAVGNSQVNDMEALLARGEDAKAAKEFESLFASMLVKEMRSSIEGGFFGKGPGADTYGQWFDKEMGAAVAADNGLGLAGVLKVQLGLDRKVAEEGEAAPEYKS